MAEPTNPIRNCIDGFSNGNWGPQDASSPKVDETHRVMNNAAVSLGILLCTLVDPLIGSTTVKRKAVAVSVKPKSNSLIKLSSASKPSVTLW